MKAILLEKSSLKATLPAKWSQTDEFEGHIADKVDREGDIASKVERDKEA